MSSEFRASTRTDAAQIIELAERVLGVAPGNPMFTPAQLHWKYWQPWPGWSGSRSFVLTRAGRIVAHAGVLPLLTHGEQPTTLLHPFDWASEPSSVGAGAVLLKRLAGLADGLLIAGGSTMTQRMAGPLGFRAAGQVARFAVRVGPAGAASSTAGAAYAARQVAPAEVLEDPGATPAGWLRFRRSADWLGELARCPAVEVERWAVTHDGASVGGFLLTYAPFQARIAAFWCDSERQDDASGILRAALARASARQQVEEVVCMSNVPSECRALELAGFTPCESVPLFVLAARERLPVATQLAFQMLDGDVAFLHHGGRQPWL